MTKRTEREQMALRHCLDAVHRSHAGLTTGLAVGVAAASFKRLRNGETLPVARLHIAAAQLDRLAEKGYLVLAGECTGPKGGLHKVYRANVDHPYWLDPNHRL